MHLLDTPHFLTKYRADEFLSLLAAAPQKLAEPVTLQFPTSAKQMRQIVLVGRGAGIIASQLAAGFSQLAAPLISYQGGKLASFVGKYTLVIGLDALAGPILAQATRRGSVVIDVSYAASDLTDVWQTYRILIEVLAAAGLVPVSSLMSLAKLAKPLQAAASQWATEIPTAHNLAKQLAEQALGKTLTIYSGPLMQPAAAAWKFYANVYAKNTAWAGQYPEAGLDDFKGWQALPVEKPFAVFDLLSAFEDDEIQQQIAQTQRQLSGRRPQAVAIEAAGDSALEHALYLILLGQFTATCLALLAGVDPKA